MSGPQDGRFAGLVLLVLTTIAGTSDGTAQAAQRATEDVVTSAEDGFGTSIGRDSIGLYRTTWVRGFSPTTAGNARIDGLYFDQVWSPTQRISTSTAIRVGPSVFGFPFAAPTGVVDYQLRRPGREASHSLFASLDSLASLAIEADAVVPLSADGLSLGLGFALYGRRFHNGTSARQMQGAAMLRWNPSPRIDVQSFWNGHDNRDDEIGPVYAPAARFLPSRLRSGWHIGPGWAKDSGRAANYGLIGSMDAGRAGLVRVGLFRSLLDNDINYRNIIVDLGRDGIGRQLIIVDPPARNVSTSGEVRWTGDWRSDQTRHRLHLSVRGRLRERSYGGGDTIDLGLVDVNRAQRAPRPAYAFSDQNEDRVEQALLGLAYEGRWSDIAELNASVQYSHFSKSLRRPSGPPLSTRSGRVLGNVAVGLHVTPSIAVYGSWTRGLEEGGVAPVTAANLNEAAPATLTRQMDAGVRVNVNNDLKLIAGVFQVQKPYFAVDRVGIWRDLGAVRNRGIELSVSGKIASNLTLVGGAAFIDAAVLGNGADFDAAGRRPINTASTTATLAANWAVPDLDGVSVNLGVTHVGRLAATVDNFVDIPKRTSVDAGIRYNVSLKDAKASMRLQASNLGDVYGYSIRGPGAYTLAPTRVVTLSLVVDR